MKYYIIPYELAVMLCLTEYRYGNKRLGYLVNQSDLSAISIDEAFDRGAREIPEDKATIFLAELNN